VRAAVDARTGAGRAQVLIGRAQVLIGPGRAVYAGPSLHLAPHSGSVACLAIGVDDVLEVHVDHQVLTARTVLIPARMTHRVVALGERTAFCYMDPATAHRHSLVARVRAGHDREDELVELAAQGDVAGLIALAVPGDTVGPDVRVRCAARRLAQPGNTELSAAELAAGVHLSTSRFLHLFAEQTGTGVRRYRLWARMLAAATVLSNGGDLTRAAADAGFATPSHLSSAFRRMFGLTPGQLLGHRPRITVEDGSYCS
jgi:AraC-like DNA-binding protein